MTDEFESNMLSADDVETDDTTVDFESDDSGGREEEEDDENQTEQRASNITVCHRGSFCYFCKKFCVKMKRHLLSVHKNEPEVKNLTPDEVRMKVCELTRLGDSYHNMQVLDARHGVLKVVKNYGSHYANYGPCPQCFGFIMKKNLKVHMSVCPKRNETSNTKHIVSDSNALTFSFLMPTENPSFKLHVLSEMREDAVKEIILENKSIRDVGLFLYQKYGPGRPEEVRQTMRILARILATARRELKQSDLSIEQLFTPANFDLIIRITKEMSGLHTYENQAIMKTPSVAKRFRYTIKNILVILKGRCLRENDSESFKRFESFEMLIDMEWGTLISATASASESLNKRRNYKIMPLTDDLMKLSTYVAREMESARRIMLESEFSVGEWFRLAKACLVRILLFNRKRTGEMGKMKISDFSRIQNSRTINAELLNTFSTTEKALASKMKLIAIDGKRRTVPVLLTEEMVDAMRLLLTSRNANQLNAENCYFFPSSSDSSKCMRGYATLREMTLKAELREPLSITGTQLRKFMATTLQVLNLKEHELDYISKHMGHDILVHRQYYRLQNDAVELAKVSKVLLLMDKGKLGEFRGKTLDELEINGN